MVNLAGIMERSDEQILPALYRYIGASFRASPSQLGYLTLSRALVQAMASPLGGIAGHYYNRVWVIACGCLMWGTCTALFAGTHSVAGGAIFWAINGIGLSLVIPNGQSLIADLYGELDRGKAFGALYLTGAIGAMLGTLYATNMGHTLPLGIEGWRFVFLSIAFASAAIGVGTFFLAHDPRFADDGQVSLKAQGKVESLAGTLKEAVDFMKLPTFGIVILQGIVGSTPWNGMVFLTLYLQLLGMTDFQASALYALFLGGTALGGLLGGWVGDIAARFYPNHGRIFVTQFSVLAGIPFSILIMKGLPYDGGGGTVALYGIVMTVMGSLISWAAPAFNNPAFAEIVPAHMRNLIYSFDRTLEMAIAALAAPIVGIMAQTLFGFSGTASTTGHEETDHRNARALGNALLVCMIVPWFLCFVFYTGLHFTYPKDRARAQQLAQAFPLSAAEEADGSEQSPLRVQPSQSSQRPPATANDDDNC